MTIPAYENRSLTDMPGELWRDVTGFEGAYMVSNLGRVKTLARTVSNATGLRNVPSLIRKQSFVGKIYPYFVVTLYTAQRRSVFPIHRLVLTAFVGPRPDGFHGCHGPLGPKINALTNLRWDTPAGNKQDQMLAGTWAHGERNGQSKLVEANVREIRSSSDSARKLARKFNVSKTVVQHARKGISWKTVN
jgi:hypothetical protein